MALSASGVPPISGMAPTAMPNVDPFTAFGAIAPPVSQPTGLMPPGGPPGIIGEPMSPPPNPLNTGPITYNAPMQGGSVAQSGIPAPTAPGGADYQPWMQTAPDTSRFRKVKGGAPSAPIRPGAPSSLPSWLTGNAGPGDLAK